MNKTLDEAFELIESMASHNFSWTNERAMQPPQPVVMQHGSPQALEAKLDSLTSQISQLMLEKNGKALVPVSAVLAPCQICGIEGHSPQECPYFSAGETQVAEVNYTQNQGPFSQSYNPSWRHHPNPSYKNAAPQSYPQAAPQNYASTSQQNFRPQGHMQQPQ